MQEKYGFVYIWYDRKHKRYYIGSHWGTEDDGYICSQPWMKNSYKRRPDDFKRRILSRIYTNKLDTRLKEYDWLKLVKDEELRIRYYNQSNKKPPDALSDDELAIMYSKISIANKGKKLSEETKQKISKGNKGKKRSPEMIEKMSERMKGKIPWQATNKSNNKGLKRSKEFCEKVSKGKTGKSNYKIMKPIICFNTGQEFSCAKEAAIILDLDNSCITKVCKGKLSHTKGYVFYYKNLLAIDAAN